MGFLFSTPRAQWGPGSSCECWSEWNPRRGRAWVWIWVVSVKAVSYGSILVLLPISPQNARCITYGPSQRGASHQMERLGVFSFFKGSILTYFIHLWWWTWHPSVHPEETPKKKWVALEELVMLLGQDLARRLSPSSGGGCIDHGSRQRDLWGWENRDMCPLSVAVLIDDFTSQSFGVTFLDHVSSLEGP